MPDTLLTWNALPYNELDLDIWSAILALRQEVFIVEQRCCYQDLDGTDPLALHLWGEDKEGKVVAYCRIFPPGIKYEEASIGRVLTHRSVRRQGQGRPLMELAIQLVHTWFKAGPIRISAQDYLVEFYGSLGFQSTGKKYLEDHLPHTEMLRP